MDSRNSISFREQSVKMFPDYTKLVLQDYEKKRKSNALSLRLLHPTTARIKEECLVVCANRFSRKDGNVLEAFFREGNDKAAVLKAIERTSPDDFKPLINYLRKKTGNTAERNIELLAWLIDFEPRPHEVGKKYEEVEVEETSGERPFQPPGEGGLDEDIMETGGTGRRHHTAYFLSLAVLAFLIFMGVLAYKGMKNSHSLPLGASGITGHESCMYWSGDHYQQVSCTQKINGTPIIALDSQKIQYFRRINREDTISLEDIGKVWYIKLNGKIEYYTSDGFHPEEINRRLKPITAYIIDKYILSKKESIKGK